MKASPFTHGSDGQVTPSSRPVQKLGRCAQQRGGRREVSVANLPQRLSKGPAGALYVPVSSVLRHSLAPRLRPFQ